MALNRELGIFLEYGVQMQRINQKEDWGQIENQLKKEPKKYQPNSSVMNQSKSLFKMEEKFNINPYHGEIDALKLNHWLQQLEFYFGFHQINEGQNISFVELKLEAIH